MSFQILFKMSQIQPECQKSSFDILVFGTFSCSSSKPQFKLIPKHILFFKIRLSSLPDISLHRMNTRPIEPITTTTTPNCKSFLICIPIRIYNFEWFLYVPQLESFSDTCCLTTSLIYFIFIEAHQDDNVKFLNETSIRPRDMLIVAVRSSDSRDVFFACVPTSPR